MIKKKGITMSYYKTDQNEKQANPAVGGSMGEARTAASPCTPLDALM